MNHFFAKVEIYEITRDHRVIHVVNINRHLLAAIAQMKAIVKEKKNVKHK